MFQSQNRRVGVTSRRRLRGYEYSNPGFYFLTVSINDRTHRLGTVINDLFRPYPAGEMVERVWREAPERFPSLTLDSYCVMPNHFHAVLGIGIEDPSDSGFPSVASVMNWFKSATTVEYIRNVRSQGWPRFERHLWLEGYYDHIVRGDHDLERIRDYIESNPANWQKDGFYAP